MKFIYNQLIMLFLWFEVGRVKPGEKGVFSGSGANFYYKPACRRGSQRCDITNRQHNGGK